LPPVADLLHQGQAVGHLPVLNDGAFLQPVPSKGGELHLAPHGGDAGHLAGMSSSQNADHRDRVVRVVQRLDANSMSGMPAM
jgi:hypothetical protein